MGRTGVRGREGWGTGAQMEDGQGNGSPRFWSEEEKKRK